MAVELGKCECCGHGISSRAPSCPRCGDVIPVRRSGHEMFAYAVVFLISIPSLLGTVWALFLATGISAPQQCSVVAGCMALTVIPYCYARAVEKRDGR